MRKVVEQDLNDNTAVALVFLLTEEIYVTVRCCCLRCLLKNWCHLKLGLVRVAWPVGKSVEAWNVRKKEGKKKKKRMKGEDGNVNWIKYWLKGEDKGRFGWIENKGTEEKKEVKMINRGFFFVNVINVMRWKGKEWWISERGWRGRQDRWRGRIEDEG